MSSPLRPIAPPAGRLVAALDAWATIRIPDPDVSREPFPKIGAHQRLTSSATHASAHLRLALTRSFLSVPSGEGDLGKVGSSQTELTKLLRFAEGSAWQPRRFRHCQRRCCAAMSGAGCSLPP